MPSQRKLTVTIVGDASKLQRAFKNADKAGAKFQAGMKKAGTAVVAGLAAVGTGSVSAFLSFDDAMSKSLSIMGNVSDAMRGDMANAAREVAQVTRFSAAEAADSFFFLASAGLSAAESLEALPTVAAFATAGAFDMALATDLLTDAQSALGLSVDDTAQNMTNMTAVSDVLVKANTLANATVQQFSESLTNKAGAAIRAVGKDLEEGVAVLSAFADQGVKGTEAGTALAIVLRDLQTASLKNKNAWEQMQVATFDASGEMRNIADIVGDLEGVLGGASDEQKKMTLTQLGFKDKSQSFILALLGQSEAIRDYEAKLRDAGGVTEEVAGKQLESAAAQFDMFKSKVIDAGIALGQKLVPALIDGTKGIEAIAKWFRELEPAARVAIVGVTALSAALLVLYAHPVIAGLALVAAGIVAIGAAAAENKTEVGQLTDELNELGEISVETIEDIIGSDAAKDIATLEKIGLTLQDVKEGLEENAFATERTAFEWVRARGASESLFFASQGLQRALEHLQNQFNDGKVAAEVYKKEQDAAAAATAGVEKDAAFLASTLSTVYQPAVEHVGLAIGDMVAAEKDQIETLDLLEDATYDAAEAQRDLTASYLEADDPALALLDAGRRYDKALRNLHAAQGDTKTSAEDLEGAERDVFDAFTTLISATSEFANDRDAIDAFIALATQAGLSQEAIGRMVGSIVSYNNLQVDRKFFDVVTRPGRPNPFSAPAGPQYTPPPPNPFGAPAGGNEVHVHIEGRSAQSDKQLVDMVLDKATRQAKHAGRPSFFG